MPLPQMPELKRPVNTALSSQSGQTRPNLALIESMPKHPMQCLLPLFLLLLLSTSAHAIRVLDVIASPLLGTWINQADDSLRQAACTQWQQQKLPTNSQLLVISGQSAHYFDTATQTQLYWHLSQNTASYTRNDRHHIQGLALAKTDIASPTDTMQAFDFQLNPDDSLTAPYYQPKPFTAAPMPHAHTSGL